MADIFLSYARADQQKVAQLVSALEAVGYSVWWDRRIQSGSEFSRDIEKALAETEAVIVCWSEAANESRWVKDEANSGADANKLFAISLDGSLPPIGFRQFHCTDFSNWRGGEDEHAFRSLESAVKGVVDETPVRSTAMRAAKRDSSMPGKKGFSLVLLLAPIRVADATLSNIGSGLNESIAAGLSRFSMLTVVGSGEGKHAANYRLEGSLQGDRDLLRLTVRLVELPSGKEVWGRSYDRDVANASLLRIQDDLSAQVVAAVGDPYGAMLRDLQQQVVKEDPKKLSAFEAVLRHSSIASV